MPTFAPMLDLIETREANMMVDPVKGLTPAPTVVVAAPTTLSPAAHMQPRFDVIDLLLKGAGERRLDLASAALP